jgi:hypothetical protein
MVACVFIACTQRPTDGRTQPAQAAIDTGTPEPRACASTLPCDAGPVADAANLPHTAAAATQPPTPQVFAPDALDPDAAIATAAARDEVKSAKNIGHTSVVWKVTFKSGSVAAFKPRSKKGGERFRGEVAARKLARALGLEARVPAAVVVALPESPLRAALGARFDEDVAPDNGYVVGALIPWVEQLSFPPLEREPAVSQWKAWLSGVTSPTGAQATRAEQLSTLVAFDFLTGNFDRYSGANIGEVRGGLLYVDNDGAFMDVLTEERDARNEARLHETKRFSRSLRERVRTLREFPLGLEAVWGQVELHPGKGPEPLLAAKVQKQVAARLARLDDYLSGLDAPNFSWP